MKKGTIRSLIGHLITLGLYIIFSWIFFKEEMGVPSTFLLIGVFYLLVFIIIGIPALIKKIMKRKADFVASFLSGLVGFLIAYVFIAITETADFLDLYDSTENLIQLIAIFLSFFYILFNAIFYKKTGFLYFRLIYVILNKIYRGDILPLSPISGTDDKVGTEAEKSEEVKKAGTEDEISKPKEPSKIAKQLTPFITLLAKKKKIIIIAACALVVLIAGSITGIKIYKNITADMTAKIETVIPTNSQYDGKPIRVIYLDDISFKNPDSPGNVIKFTPEIVGSYRIEGRTLMFIPDKDLPLSTRYKASINTQLLKSPGKRFVEGKEFIFHTRMMEVADCNVFYNITEETKMVDEMIAEIRFTLPVDVESAKERISVVLDKTVVTNVTIESSNRDNLLYVKIRNIKQTMEEQKVTITLDKGIMPVNGTTGIEEDFDRTISIKAIQALHVENVSTHPVVGNTYIAVKFNMPLSERHDLKQYFSVIPSVPFKISSEYRYVVLEADFQPNKNYDVIIDKNIMAKNGTTMKNTYEQSVSIRDLQPYAKFTTDGKILPRTDNLNIEFTTLNLDTVKFTVEKVYKNNLHTGNGHYLYSKEFAVTGGTINEELTSLVNLRKLKESKYQGLYKIRVSDPYSYDNYNSMLVNITNIGLIVKNDGNNLHVFAVNILTLQPMAGIKITLISDQNQIIQTRTTNSGGKVVIGKYWKTIENQSPLLLVAEDGDDFTYLRLNQNEMDYSTFDVAGHDFNAYTHEAFIKTERGVYRPGDDVFASLIVRKANLENPADAPYTIVVKDPTGKEVEKQVVKLDTSGMQALTIPTKYEYKTGSYSIGVMNNYSTQIGSTGFKIEDFIPHKIEIKAEVIEQVNQTVKIKVKSKELHGGASGGLKVQASVDFSSIRFTSKQYPEYSFYDDKKNDFYTISENLGESKLDDNGEKIYEIMLPDSIEPPSAVRLNFYVTVFDDSGRPVSDAVGVDMHKYSTYYGLAVTGKKPYQVDKSVIIKYAALDSASNLVKSENVRLRIERKVWYTIFKRYSWKGNYSSEYYTEILYDKEITIDKLGTHTFKPDKGGTYTVTLNKEGGMQSTKSFYVSGYERKEYRDMTDPYKLIMELDKPAYAVGQTAYLSIIAPFDGNLLLGIERDQIYETRFIKLDGGKAVVSIPVTETFLPNMYITATAFRKPTYENNALPPVSYGVVNIAMDRKNVAQEITIDVPDKIRSSDGLTVNLHLPGGGNSKVIIAAVDEGILQITNYQHPDPYAYYYRKRRLSIRTSTTLKDLLPDIAPYKRAFGGGEDRDLERRHLNPVIAKRVKSMSLYSGILECDAMGRLTHTFKMDQFNGKLRVMVISCKGKTFGASRTNVTVSDPIVLSPGIPRIMSPGDKAMIPVKIFNKTGKDGTFKVTASVDGPLVIKGDQEYDVSIADGGEQKVSFNLVGDYNADVAHIRLDASGNNEMTFHETELAVRPATPLDTQFKNAVVNIQEEGTLAIDTNYIPQGQFKSLTISTNRLIKCMGALEYLIRYPYGCTEQTVSKAFPLIYLREMAKSSSLFMENPVLIDKYLNVAITKVSNRVGADGEVSFWNHGYYYSWVSSYVAHFMIEAKRNGLPVPENAYNNVLKRLGLREIETVKGTLDRRFDSYAENMQYQRSPYTLYLRALAGKPDFDGMKIYYDRLNTKEKNINLGERERCLMAAAYALANERDRAREFIPETYKIVTAVRQMRMHFDSYVRNTALYLYALSLIDPYDKRVKFLENEIYKKLSRTGHFGNTHDTAWALIALSQIRRSKDEELSAEVYVDGQLWKTLDKMTVFKTDELTANNYVIKNLSSVPLYYSYVTFGYPLSPDKKEITNGLKVTKKYYDEDGHSIDVKNVKQGDQLVVTLTVENETDKEVSNLMLLDLLPAGFEIENVRLASRGDFPQELHNNINIAYEDIRDDRILIAVETMNNGFIQYSYVVRAISPGTYTIPQFQAEAMYDPDIFGRTESLDDLIIKEK